jgi:acetyltransferase
MTELTQITLPMIGRITVRRLSQNDERRYREFMDHITKEDLRLRFFCAMSHPNDKLINQLIHPDPHSALVLVAIEEATQHVIGVARLHVNVDENTAEYAVLVRSALKGRGLGWVLMNRIIKFAKAKGLRSIQGQVLAENEVMLKMCRELGFEIKRDPGDPGLRIVWIELNKQVD